MNLLFKQICVIGVMFFAGCTVSMPIVCRYAIHNAPSWLAEDVIEFDYDFEREGYFVTRKAIPKITGRSSEAIATSCILAGIACGVMTVVCAVGVGRDWK